MERLLRPALDRWVLAFLLVLSGVAEFARTQPWRWSGGPGEVFVNAVVVVINVITGVAAGYVLYGLVLLVIVLANRARIRLRTHV